MARPALGYAKDPKTGDEVRVSANYYSINGTEPMRVPDDLRSLDDNAIAAEILRRHCGKTDDENT